MTAVDPTPTDRPEHADDPTATPQPAADAPADAGYQRLLLIVVMLAVMAFGSLMTIVTVSLDRIAADVGSSRATLTWMITGLMLAMAVVTPVAGKLGDIAGHRRMFLLGLIGGVITTVASALAWDAGSLIAFRVLFGVTGAFVMPNGMALMMHAYGPERRASAMGWFQFAMTGAPTIGLVLGGPLIEIIGWRWLFAGFAGISVIATIVGFRVIRPTPRQEGVSVDYLGAATLAGGVLAGLLALTRVSTLARDGQAGDLFTDPATLVLTALAVIGIAAFVLVENRSPDPMLRLDYFRRRNFTLPMVAGAFMQFAYMGGFVVTPALLGLHYGLTEGAIALLLAPRPGAFSLASPIGGYLVGRLGERTPVVIGAGLMVSAMAAFAVSANLSDSRGLGLVVMVVGLVFTGVSAGISQPAIASLVVGAVDRTDMGIANGMQQQITFIGVVSGIQTMNVFVGDEASVGRFTLTFVYGTVIAALGLVAALGIARRVPSGAASGPASTGRA